MGLKTIRLSVTTAADGSGSAVSQFVSGLLYAVDYDKGTFAAGVDVTLTVANSELATTLLTLTDANASALYHPRIDSHGATGTALTKNETQAVVIGVLKLTIAQGGDAKTGSVVVVIQE